MDWLTFVAEMTKALAWPVALVILVTVLRKHIADAIDRLRSFKHGETELSFGEELAVTQTAAVDFGITALRPLMSPDLESLAAEFPAAAVLQGWKKVDAELIRLAGKVHIDGVRNATQVVAALERAGYLRNGLANIVHYLRTLRNIAVHGSDSEVTEADAKHYLMIAKSVAERLANESAHA